MAAAWILGLILVYYVIDWSRDHWFHAKLLLVILLSAYTGVLGKWTRQFANDENTRSPKFYRIANEVPTVLMVLIVILVIVKPF
jgi:putative membrane protein